MLTTELHSCKGGRSVASTKNFFGRRAYMTKDEKGILLLRQCAVGF